MGTHEINQLTRRVAAIEESNARIEQGIARILGTAEAAQVNTSTIIDLLAMPAPAPLTDEALQALVEQVASVPVTSVPAEQTASPEARGLFVLTDNGAGGIDIRPGTLEEMARNGIPVPEVSNEAAPEPKRSKAKASETPAA